MSAFTLNLGRVVCTRSVNATAQDHPVLHRFITRCLQRHRCGDWGDVDPVDIGANDGAAATGERVLSAYELPEAIQPHTADDVLWVITDAGRETTTVLWPSEY